jgi:hypothetical protein
MFGVGEVRRSAPTLLFMLAAAAGCDGVSSARGGSACLSGTGWYEIVDVPAGTQALSLTACLAGACLSGEIPIRDGTAEAPCVMEDIRTPARFVDACAYRVAGGDADADAGGYSVLINVNFLVSDPVADGLADGDEASLVVATPDGAPVYDLAGPVTYLVSHDTTGNRCMQGTGSWIKNYDSGVGDPS